ncbi:MAG: hypothetical protein GY765_01155, partial [bacterium]|nr:hypothetical protein [bacterium]
KQKRIREEVDKTLGLMDNMEKLEGGPYFYTRLEAEIRSREKSPSWLPAFLPAKLLRPALALLLVINVVSTLVFFTTIEPGASTTIGTEKQETTLIADKQEYMSTFLEDYSLNRNTYDVDVTEKITGDAT